MSVSFREIDQEQKLEISNSQKAIAQQDTNELTGKMKVPSLQEKLAGRQRQDLLKFKENAQQLQEHLEKKNALFQMEREKGLAQLKHQKLIENIELKRSMGNGQPKHAMHFRRANKELPEFQEQLFLLPTIEKARQYQIEDDQSLKNKKAYLKTKATRKLEEPWNPTKQVATYFDNIYLMKPPEQYMQVSYATALTQAKQRKAESMNSLKSIREMSLRPDTTREKNDKKSVKLDDNQESFSVERAHFKPTSANNLVIFKQQLAKEQQEKDKHHHKNVHSSSTLGSSSVKLHDKSVNNLSQHSRSHLESASTMLANKEWINAYHMKETFSRPLFDNLDIKLQAGNPHFKPFKPTKSQGYDFNKYLSLGAGERAIANQRGSLDCLDNIENESFEIKQPKKIQKKTVSVSNQEM